MYNYQFSSPILIITINMLMPVTCIELHIYEPYRYSITTAFWAKSTSLADGLLS
jgi:hypothetical protein